MGSLSGPRIALLAAILTALLALWLVYLLRGILAPFVLAFVLAYVLTPLVDGMEARGLRRVPSILLIFLATFAVLAFGMVTLGKRMTGEMIDLYEDLLRPERVQSTITITGRADQALSARATIRSEGETNPFVLLDPADGKLFLEPGQQTALRVEFAPLDVAEHAGALVLEGLAGTPHAIPLRGNLMERGDQKGAWERRHGGARPLGEWTLSAGGLDFGLAGPHLVRRITSKTWRLGRYLGFGEESMGAATTWVTTHSHQLVDVLFERTTRFLSGSVTTRLLSGFVSGVMLLVLVPFVAFFFLKEGRRITRALVEMVPNAYFEMTLNLVHSINHSIGGYIRGQLLAVSVVAFLSVTGLILLELPYAIPVGIAAGLANMIPYLGPVIGIASATGVALATASGGAMVAKVVLLFLCIQIVDNVLVQPIVVARSVALHPLVVLSVVMMGSEFGGVVGMLIAVPATGILKVSVQRFHEGVRGYRISGLPRPDVRGATWSRVSQS